MLANRNSTKLNYAYEEPHVQNRHVGHLEQR